MKLVIGLWGVAGVGLIAALFIAFAALLGVIEKGPDEPPYKILLPSLMLGGFLAGIVGDILFFFVH